MRQLTEKTTFTIAVQQETQAILQISDRMNQLDYGADSRFQHPKDDRLLEMHGMELAHISRKEIITTNG